MHSETQMRRAELIDKIRAASHAELARLWRFAPVGSFYFTDPIVWEEFARRFEGFGGMTPAVSKEIGWDG